MFSDKMLNSRKLKNERIVTITIVHFVIIPIKIFMQVRMLKKI